MTQNLTADLGHTLSPILRRVSSPPKDAEPCRRPLRMRSVEAQPLSGLAGPSGLSLQVRSLSCTMSGGRVGGSSRETRSANEAFGDGAANGVLGLWNRFGGAAGNPRQQRLLHSRPHCTGRSVMTGISSRLGWLVPDATCYETKNIKRTPGARGGIAACPAKAPTFAPGSLLFKT